ncbi:MAG TPA: glycosyl hydrolase family 18 protein [Paenibacillus sp.]|jgi:chitinase
MAFGPLLDSTRTYAADQEPADQSIITLQPEEPSDPPVELTQPENESVDAAILSSDSDVKSGPTNLEVEELYPNKVVIKWDFIENDANEIDIWNADTGKDITWGNLWTRTIPGLTPETTYRVYITWNKDRPSKEYKSNILEFTTPADTSEYKDPPLTPPSYLKITGITEEALTLNWGVSPEATGYDLYVNGAWKAGTWLNEATSIIYSLGDQIEAGTKLTFTVGAQKSGVSPSVDSNAVTIIWGTLESPQDLQVITATRSTVSLGWAPVPGATSYDVFRDGTYLGSSEDNRYVASGLVEGKSYSFAAMAKNNLWDSPMSATVKAVPGSDYTQVSYYTQWSVYDREFYPEDVDASKITHINYAFADLCWKKFGTKGAECQNEDIPLQQDYVFDGEIVIGDTKVDLENFREFRSIREEHPNLKLMASVGGWSWSKNFSNMAADEITRRSFANSVVKFLREYELDGIDIDWEYPVEGGEEENSRRPEDKQNFTLMMATLRDALDAAGSVDGKYYLLTMASGQGDNFVVNADFANSVAYLDFINIMTYDYSGSWDTLANHNSPLFYDKKLSAPNAPRNNVRGGLLGHLNGGVPNYKLVVGVPFYGKGWEGCPAGGEYQTCTEKSTSFGTWETGIFDYSDLDRNYVNKNGYDRHWNDAAKVAYLYNADKQIFMTYNDENTMLYTASLVKTLDIAGTMNWDISGDRDNKLLTALNSALPIDGKMNAQELAAPRNLKVASTSSKSVQVKWDAVEGANAYEVYVDNQFTGYSEATSYTIGALTPASTYKVHVLAIDRDGEKFNRVSTASESLQVKTATDTDSGSPSGPSSPSGGGSSSGTTPTPQPGSKDKGLLPVKIVKEGERAVVTLPVAETVKLINNAQTTSFKLVIEEGLKQAEITLPQEVIAALAEIDNSSLTVVLNGMEFTFPVALFPAGTSIKLTLGAIDPSLEEALRALLAGKKTYGQPFQLKLEKISTDGKTIESVSFGNNYVSGKVSFGAAGVNTGRIAGVVYIPGKDHLHTVPALFAKNADAITAELKLNANGIFTLIDNGSSSFKDDPDWAAQDISSAVTKMIASGDSADQFGAKRSITRTEVIAMIVRGLGLIPQENSTAPYADVSLDSQYAEEIAAAKQAGLIQGRSADSFDPDAAITRQELAVMLANAMKYVGKGHTANTTLLAGFKDHLEIADYAQSSMALMVEQNIMKGVSVTSLSPRTNVTKAQMAVTVMRMLRSLGLSN